MTLCEAEKAAPVGLTGGIDTVTGDRLPPLESFQVLLKGRSYAPHRNYAACKVHHTVSL